MHGDVDQVPVPLFWAKLDAAETSFHPLLCHLIDVGCVAQALWREVVSPAFQTNLADGLGLSLSTAPAWIGFLAATHDVGKASPCFQFRAESTAVTSQYLGWQPSPPLTGPNVPHGIISGASLRAELSQLFDVPPDVTRTLGTVIGGHHGMLPEDHVVTKAAGTREAGRGPWSDARRQLLVEIAQLFGVPGSERPNRIDHATALNLAGFVCVADWIGSVERFFPYIARVGATPPSIDVHTYAVESREQAARALSLLGWTGWTPPRDPRSFADLFPAISEPRPVQHAVESMSAGIVAQGPALVIIEAPTGDGKTEAALALADRWGVDPGPRGMYVALPTMATSDQMFARVARFLSQRYSREDVKLQLLHGHAALSAEFQLMLERGREPFEPTAIGQDSPSSSPENVTASAWFTYRKRGLLAPFGVGTIDQLLLSVLQSRHVFVRTHALASKVVIIDEVHAYDTYMSTLLGRLLEWLGALGSPTILLSATLPSEKRRELCESYRRGLGAPVSVACDEPYPRITWIGRHAAGSQSVAASPVAARELLVRWIERSDTASSLGTHLAAALDDGGCAAVVCNTVREAQDTYIALRDLFPGFASDGSPVIDLLHARCPFEERAQRERRTMNRFGPPGAETKRPDRAVLVATQIIEQSLDLDFDLLATSVAPVDLLLQRAGRLHRHQRERPDKLQKPQVWIMGSKTDDGVPRFDGGTAYVYDTHYLLRSWAALQGREVLRIPDDVEALIETVYAPDAPCPWPQGSALAHEWDKTRKQQRESLQHDQSAASDRWVKSPHFDGPVWRLTSEPRDEDSPELHPAHRALTRLTPPSVQVVCLYGASDKAYLDADRTVPVKWHKRPDLAATTSLLRRSLTINDRRLVFSLLDEEVPSGWRVSSLLRYCRPLVFPEEGAIMIRGINVVLDRDLGLHLS